MLILCCLDVFTRGCGTQPRLSRATIRRVITVPKRSLRVSNRILPCRHLTLNADADWFYQNITHFILTEVNARYDAPLSDMKAKYPVIIFTHGQERYPPSSDLRYFCPNLKCSLPENHTFLLEKLASKGFVVLGLYHDDTNGKYPGPLSFRLMEIASAVRTVKAMNEDAKHFLHDRLDFTHGVGLHGHSLGKCLTSV